MTSADWPILPVKRVATVKLGKMVQSEPSSPDDVEAPYLRAAHVQPNGRIADVESKAMWFRPGELKALDLRAGDVVVVEGGAGYGRSSTLTADMPGWGFQNSINRVRPVPGAADGRFIDYALQHSLRSGQTELLVNTATIPHFTAEKVAAVRAPFPDLIEQRAIADFLDRETAQIDAMVDAQERLVALLDERRTAAVKRAVFRGVRSDPLRPSGVEWIGDVPAHWQVLPLRRFAQFTTGITPPTEDEANYDAETNGRPWIRPEDLEPTGRPTVASRHLSPEGWDTVRPVPAGSTLVCCIGATLGKVGITNVVAATNQQITAVTSSADDRYVFHALSASHQGLRLLATGNTLPILNNDRLASLPVPIPPRDEQHEIAAYLDRSNMQTDALIARARESIALMKERRAAVISAAVTGRIDVRTGIERVERDLGEARV